MDRTERLLSLIASLLDASEPVSIETIRSWFPADYADVSDEAFARKFERDKADIVALGIPLRHMPAGDGLEEGYLVDREEAYLSPIDFDAEEMTALIIAGSGVLTQSEFPYHRDLERALDKIELLAESGRVAGARSAARRVLLNHPVQQQGDGAAVADCLQRISDAMDASKRLRMVYHTLYSGEVRERTVDPYGLRCWRGRWAVVGYCHERDEVRLFSLHRIRELAVNGERPGEPDFAVPDGFSLAEWQMQPSWRYRMHEPMAARVEVDPGRAWIVEGQLGPPTGDGAGGWTAFDVEVTNADGLVEWALRQGPAVRIVAPPELRDRIVTALQTTARHHGAVS